MKTVGSAGCPSMAAVQTVSKPNQASVSRQSGALRVRVAVNLLAVFLR